VSPGDSGWTFDDLLLIGLLVLLAGFGFMSLVQLWRR
jgi:hypothetical protein